MAELLTALSPERIAQELKKMLVHHRRRQAMELAQKTGLLAVIFPELIDGMANLGTDWKRTLTALEQLQSPRFEAAAAVLWHTVPSPPDGQLKGLPEFGTVRSICRRLRLSNLESELITWLTREQSAFKDIKTLRQCQLFRLLAEPAIEELLQVATAINDAYGGPTADVALARQVLNTVPAATFNPPVLIDGKTLIDLGLSPGPIFKSLLDAVRDAQLNAEIRTRAEAIVLLNHLRAENSP